MQSTAEDSGKTLRKDRIQVMIESCEGKDVLTVKDYGAKHFYC